VVTPDAETNVEARFCDWPAGPNNMGKLPTQSCEFPFWSLTVMASASTVIVNAVAAGSGGPKVMVKVSPDIWFASTSWLMTTRLPTGTFSV